MTVERVPASVEAPQLSLSRRSLLRGTLAAGSLTMGGALLSDRSATAAVGGRFAPSTVGGVADPVGLSWGLYANNPFGSVTEQRLIIDAMRRALNEAPSGATAHLTALTGIERQLTEDIISAHKRGVNCRISMDDQMESSPWQHQLASVLGTDRRRRSCFISLVGTGRAGRGQAHSKLFAIDRTGASGKPFTMIGSSNLGSNDIIQKWNTMYGTRRPGVFGWFAQVHEEILRDTPLASPYRKGGPFGRFTTYVYPELGSTWETDDRNEFFGTIDPVGAKIYATQHLWPLGGRGKRLAKLMVELVAAGAEVFVNGGQHCTSTTIEFLRNGGVDAALCGKRGNGTMIWPHCKYWSVVSPSDESCAIFDGSLNTGATEHSEDMAVKVTSLAAAEAYAAHWETVRRVSTS